MQSLSLQIAKIDLNYKLQLLASEYQKQSCEKGVLKHFEKFTEKHLFQSQIFNKVAGCRQLFL